MDIDNIEEFITIEKRIDTAEDQVADHARESIRDRWEFGRLMVAKRVGKQLPKGVLAELVEATGKSQRELGYRMQFAEQCPTEDEVCNRLQTCPDWKAVIKSLPTPRTRKPKEPTETPAALVTRNPHHEDIVAGVKAGKKRTEIADELGITERTVRRELELEATLEAMAPVAWDSIPGNQREKLEATKRAIRRELDKEHRAGLAAEVAKHKAELDQSLAAYKAQLRAEAEKERASRDVERARYQTAVDAYRAKGLITPADYKLIKACLHPDNAFGAEKRAEAFRLFNDAKIEALLVKGYDW